MNKEEAEGCDGEVWELFKETIDRVTVPLVEDVQQSLEICDLWHMPESGRIVHSGTKRTSWITSY